MKKKFFGNKFYPLLNICSIIILVQIFSSCTASKKIDMKKDYPLSDDIAYSESTDLTVQIPLGWTSAEDDICNCIDLWLIKDDFSATISFVKMNYDSLMMKSISSDELSAMLNYSRELKRNQLKEKFVKIDKDEFFEIKNNRIAAYKFQNENSDTIRVAVFKYQNNYFELSAMPSGEVSNREVNIEEILSVQNSILKSVNF